MFTNLIVSVLLWLGVQLFDLISYQELYDRTCALTAGQDSIITGIGLALILGMILLLYLIAAFQLHRLLFITASLFLILSQLSVCLLFSGSLLYWFGMGINIYQQFPLLSILPFASLAGGTLGMKIFDFNHPVSNIFLDYLKMASVSIILVFAAQIYGTNG